MTSVAEWLQQIGLERYVSLFARNDIDFEVLRGLEESDLEQLGLSFGHRKKLLRALAKFEQAGATASSPVTLPPLIESVTVAGERRQITVLFCDLVGSTALSATVDPETLKQLLAQFTDTVSWVIRRYDGYVYQILGDAVVAYFGYPVAHEDEADRAIRTGLVAIEAVSEIKQPGGSTMQARIGVATGLVVAAHIAAPDKHAVGETPNLAARLQGEAAPNSMIVCDRTRQLAGGTFQYQDLGLRTLKGIPEPQRAWRVMGQLRVESRFEAGAQGFTTPIVGREHELKSSGCSIFSEMNRRMSDSINWKPWF
jgi:class 3 adenylate cyclase